MRELIDRALQAASAAGASYADVRVVHTTQENLSARNGVVEGVSTSESLGIGVRAIASGSWGFAATSSLESDAVVDVARQAVAIAKASALTTRTPVELSALPAYNDSWEGPCRIDPFTVSLDEKLDLLLAADAALRAEPAVKIAKGALGFIRVEKTFGSTIGSFIEQKYTESAAGITAYAIEDGEILPRSYPNSHGGQAVQGGWEAILALDLPGNAVRVAEQAAGLISAAPCPSGTKTIVIDGPQLALQVHESIGHPTELDRVLGDEAAFAGTSFLTLEDLGVLQYGSEHVTVTSDATIPGSLGSFGYDDEGVPAQRDFIVKDGLFTGFLSSRESAVRIGRESNGCMRADGWNRTPLVRMTTLSLEPGGWSLPDLIADTEDGIYMETNNSWSIDDRRLNFQFACEIGWEIKNGELGKMIKNPNYTGITPQFWNSCDAVCSADHWQVWGIPNCGKGEPMQVAHVAHGAAPARFRDVQVGVGR
ncbi:MAG: TldD/PmbA family protein [Coriobacteriia bacterium]|nr:TldD/PmbA family protein [Coriobacteriia bacterium]MBN2821904.1 TldD/PmbA family protein [Coriobacteriia bacterium]